MTGTSDKLPVRQQLRNDPRESSGCEEDRNHVYNKRSKLPSTLAEYKEKAADYGFEIVESGVSSTADIPLAADLFRTGRLLKQ